jgi:TctA family transporter
METLTNLLMGFHVALTPTNFFYCVVGAFLGTFIGILPGISPTTTIAILLAFTFKMPAVASLIMLAGIYYGAHHSGSTTAIMLNMPGEPTSVVICLDGHPMARKGRAGVALFFSATASFFAGCIGILVIATLSPPLGRVALLVAPADYASLTIMALVMASVIASKSPVVTIGMAFLGVLIGTVGSDIYTGTQRFTFGISALSDNVSLVAVAAGTFAVAEVVSRMHEMFRHGHLENGGHIEAQPIRLIPTWADFRMAWKPILRGTALGAAFGILPGTGPTVSSFASYAMEKKLARDPSRFGDGAIEGVAGPEAANNASALTHFIPMLSLGIPAGSAMALMLGAMTIQGISPGPQVMTDHPDLFWGLVASMLIGNFMLLVLNLPLVGLWVKLLGIPYRFLAPAIILFCCIGVYSVNNAAEDVLIAAGFGALGCAFKMLDASPGPLVLGLVLGPSLEENIRRAMLLSRGDPRVFVTEPISLAFLCIAVALIVIFAWPRRQSPPPAELPGGISATHPPQPGKRARL